jgi:delta-aminolevulinic acid dehydratase/porphobilinogen synthase
MPSNMEIIKSVLKSFKKNIILSYLSKFLSLFFLAFKPEKTAIIKIAKGRIIYTMTSNVCDSKL